MQEKTARYLTAALLVVIFFSVVVFIFTRPRATAPAPSKDAGVATDVSPSRKDASPAPTDTKSLGGKKRR